MTLNAVMAGHSASKTRVNALMSPQSTSCLPEGVDARDKRGHDECGSFRGNYPTLLANRARCVNALAMSACAAAADLYFVTVLA